MRKKSILLSVGILLIIGCASLVFTRYAAAPQPGQSVNHPTGVTTGNSARAPAFDRARYSLTDPASIWVIVNKQHPLNPKDYAPKDLRSVGYGQYMRAEAAQACKVCFWTPKLPVLS